MFANLSPSSSDVAPRAKGPCGTLITGDYQRRTLSALDRTLPGLPHAWVGNRHDDRCTISNCTSAAKRLKYPEGHHDYGSGEMQPTRATPPRGVTIGIAVELFGLTVAIFGLGATYTGGTGAQFFTPNPPIMGVGVLIGLIGLILHVVRI